MKQATKSINVAPRIRIRIKQKHIDEAVPKHSGKCVIAEALKDQGYKYVSVDLQSIRGTDAEGNRCIWFTPHSGQRLLVKFDEGVKPRPQTLETRLGQVFEAGQKSPQGRRKNRTSRAVMKRPKGGTRNSVPIKVGGRPPPRAGLSGARRVFGMRALQM